MNRISIGVLFIIVLLAAFHVKESAFAQSDSDEARLQNLQRETDEDAGKRGQKMQTDLLAKQFQLPAGEIEKLRNSGQGWGEVTVRLALADKLVKSDPAHFPTLTAALERINILRNDGRGWGSISKELGFKLGPVVSDVRHSLNELRRDLRSEQTKAGKGNESGNGADMKREARAEHVERVQRPERPERPQRPERPERPERNGR
jgi:hypothetical protein